MAAAQCGGVGAGEDWESECAAGKADRFVCVFQRDV